MKIQAMILSDLHFGDNNSILHYEHPDRKTIFKELVKEINDRRQDQDAESRDKQIPYLILNGDIYDLSFAEYKYAFGDAKDFYKMLKKEKLFGKIIFIPGNHDHHLWWLFQKEKLIMDPIRSGDTDGIEVLVHVNSASLDLEKGDLSYYRSDPPYPTLQGATFLDALTGYDVKIVYPNLYLIFKENLERKAIVVTHGHFFESLWTFATDLFPKNLARFDASPFNLYFLEKINSAFTEFGWHTLGQAGPLSKMIEKIYEQVSLGKNAVMNGALDELRDYLDKVLDFKSESIWGSVTGYFKEKSSDALLSVGLEILKQGIKKYIQSTDRMVSTEARLRYTNVLKDKDILKQIANYLDLSKKDCRQLEITKLVFAHTHDACFKQNVKDEGLEGITFYNSGGFVKEEEGEGPEWRLLSVLDDGRII